MRRGNFTYYFKEESVVLAIPHGDKLGSTYINFHCYNMSSRRSFNHFKEELQNCRPREYNNINDVYGLAFKYGVGASAGHKPKVRVINGKIAF